MDWQTLIPLLVYGSCMYALGVFVGYIHGKEK
jgi:hypothetical protein